MAPLSIGIDLRLGGLTTPSGGGAPALIELAASMRGAAPYQTVGVPTTKNATTTQSRLKFRMPKGATRYRFWYPSRRMDLSAGEVAMPQPVTVRKAAAEYNGAFTPITFSGSRSKIITTASVITPTDWIVNTVPDGGLVWYRGINDCFSDASASYVAGKLYNTSSIEGGIPEQSWAYDPAVEIDQVDATGAMVAPGGTTANWTANYTPFAPCMMTAEFANGTKAVIYPADSIGFGLNDLPSSDGSNGNGLIARACNARGVAFTAFAISGHTIAGLLKSHILLDALLPFHTTVVPELGTNDLVNNPNAAAIWATKQTELAIYAGKRRVGTKITPRTLPIGTPDFTTTVANQAPITGFGNGEARDLYNALLLGAVGGLLDAFADISAPIEAPADHTKWAPTGFATTLTAAATQTSSTLTTALPPPLGGRLVLDPGGANQGPVSTATNTRSISVTGSSGSFVSTLSAAIGGTTTHPSGENVTTAPSDGTHPEGPINNLLAAPLTPLL